MDKTDIAQSFRMRPIHPGEILREQFMEPLNLTAGKVAKACNLPRSRIERVAGEATDITPDTALRLGKCFSVEPEFWLNLQSLYNLALARQNATDLDAIRVLRAAE
ncbi:MAG: HigA family addiction module antitoxin [Azospirillaceae bacterium]|nr:HigA family addiction module antitoxin [Azospirillaceae bacterium]